MWDRQTSGLNHEGEFMSDKNNDLADTSAVEPILEELTDDAAVEEASDKPLAKAGKRSAKAIREAEETEAKEERKASQDDETEVKKGPKPKTRNLLERKSKRYQEQAAKIDQSKLYDLSEAVKLAIDTAKVNFDPTCELHVRLNVDPRQAEQNIRGNLTLPNGTGKSVRVAVLVDDDTAKKATAAGADIAGETVILENLSKEIIDFDVLVATPKLMPKLGKFARLLGPKGLMPNPKLGTVTEDFETAIKESKAGKVEYRVDAQGIIHMAVGKISFGTKKLEENIDHTIQIIKSVRPANLKGNYIESIYITSSMGPSIRLSQ